MGGQELKEALLQHVPVTYKGIGYVFISAIIYRAVDGKIDITVELMDKNNNCVVIADPKKVNKEVNEEVKI